MKTQGAGKRVVIVLSGCVQGVGFRYTTIRLAENFLVTGYVKNLDDGTVECVMEGEELEILRFIEAIRSSVLGRCIVGDQMTWTEASGQFNRFSIAY